MTTLAALALVTVSVVQDTAGYNSWPMIQAMNGKLVCAYSRGSAHMIDEGMRGVFARVSADCGRTWSDEVCVANDLSVGEVTVGKGLDERGAMLLWVRRWGASKGHDLYRTADGVKFEKVSTPSLSPMPMQITDIFAVENGLMCLWFATDYSTNTCGSSWGTLFSADNGRNWKQTAMESGLPLAELPTEPSVVNIGGGRLLAIARREKCGGNVQFQLTSTDDGATWKRSITNIRDVLDSTPSLIYDVKTKTVYNYYYQRGAKKLRRRVTNPDSVFGNPCAWPESEVVFNGSECGIYNAGNVNATEFRGGHFLALYFGNDTNTAVFVVVHFRASRSSSTAPTPNLCVSSFRQQPNPAKPTPPSG
jgi:hypothetical protein